MFHCDIICVVISQHIGYDCALYREAEVGTGVDFAYIHFPKCQTEYQH